MSNIVDFQDKQYINLEIIKNHLNIEQQFDDDDMYLYALLDVAQAAVEKYLDMPLEDMENEDGMLPSPVVHAMLLLIGTFYAQRESVSSASMQPVPNAFEFLCDMYRNYAADLAIKR